MALQIWVPLNGDLHNQGLIDASFTNSNATINTAGKIGSCYSFNGSNAQIYAVHDKSIWNNKPMTLCTWFKYVEGTTSATIIDIAADLCLGYATNNSGLYFTYYRSYADSNGTRAGELHGTTPNYYDVNAWHHVAYVAENNLNYIYVDGVLALTFESSKYTSNFKPLLGSNYNRVSIGKSMGSSPFASGLVNDVRVYDNALSAREIKEISKGLVLHYPLSAPGKANILSGTWSEERTFTYPSSSYSDKFSTSTIIIPTASQYTLSFWAKSTVAGDKLRTHFYAPNTTTTCVSSQGITKTASDGGMDFTLSTEWTRYWVTYTQTETTAVKRIICPRMGSVNDQPIFSGTGTVSIKCIKLEEGSTATPWIPSPEDNLYSAMALDEDIVHDTSGFQHNGELVVIGKNLIDKNNVTSGGYINNTGGITNTSGWNYTNYIKVKPSTSYIASSISAGGSGTYYALYDASKTLTRTVLITASQNPTFTTTAAERYVRFSIRSLSNELDTAKLEEGTTVTDYGSEGSIEWETNSPRYTLACNPHSVNSTQNARPGTTYIRGDCELTTPNQLTIALWCNAKSEGYGTTNWHGLFCTTNQNIGDALGIDYLGSAMNHRDGKIDVNDSSASNHLRLEITVTSSSWHHYVFTYDGQAAKSYKDGVLWNTQTFSSASSLGSFKHVLLGLSRAGGVWRRNNHTYSDLRVYSTCLSAEDVLDLYQTSASLTSNGVLMASEFVES